MIHVATVSGQYSPVGALAVMDWPDLAHILCDHKPGEKAGSGWMPAKIEPGSRTGERVQQVEALVLDVEGRAEEKETGTLKLIGPPAPTVDEIAAELSLHGWAAVVSTSYKHQAPTADGGTVGPRYRLVLQVSRPLTPAEVKPLGEVVAGLVGVSDCYDDKALEPARLFYLPRVPVERMGLAESRVIEGDPLPVDELLGHACAQQADLRKLSGKRGDVIDAFNKHYDFDQILESHGYKKMGRTRWVAPSSTTGTPGVVLMPKTGRVYSHHGNDPLSGKHSHDPFSVWCILEHGNNMTEAVKAAARRLGKDKIQYSQPPVDICAMLGDETDGSNEPAFHRVSVADVLANPEPPHPFVWGPYLPTEALTMLSAHGGTGKSGFGLQLAAHVGLGREFLGHPVIRTNALFFSAEDGKKQLRLRLADVCRNHDMDPEQLDQCLHPLDATDAALLWQGEGPKRPGKETGNYEALRRFVIDHQIGLLVVDNASDSFGGDRFDKSDVTRFIRALVRLVREQSGAVLLLSHVNRGTASKRHESTESYSDSVAWHNAARSRLFMEGEEGSTQRTLKHEKCNYGPKGPTLKLEALPGCGVRLEDENSVPDEYKQGARNFVDEISQRKLLELIHEFAQRGEYVSPAPQANSTNAWGMLRGEEGFPADLKRTDVMAHFRAMERKGFVERESYTKANRHTAERWVVTEKGCDFANLQFASPAPACASDEPSNADAADARDTGESPSVCASDTGGYGGRDASASDDANPDATDALPHLNSLSIERLPGDGDAPRPD